MKVIYAQQPFPKEKAPSLFLVGPTPRRQEDGTRAPSWRPGALEILKKIDFDGYVYVPEGEDGKFKGDYLGQVEWEREGLETCTVIAAWVPREMKLMPALTTNVEFGRYVTSGRLWYGRPTWSEHTRYLDWLYTKETGRRPFAFLEELLLECYVQSKTWTHLACGEEK